MLSRKTGERKVIVQGGNAARYVPTSHIIYGLAANLYAIPFDVERLTATGGQVPVVENVMRSIGDETVAYPANFDFSKDGTLIYVPRSSALVAEGRRLVATADRSGKTNAVPGLAPGSYARPRLSPDGKNIVLETDDGSISIYDFSGKSQLRRLTFDSAAAAPVWSPDGTRLAYRSNRGGKLGIFLQNVDGTGTPERLTTAPAGFTGQDIPFTWSPDGKHLVFTRDDRLWAMELMGGKIEPLTEASTYNAAFSPDGKWLAYISAVKVHHATRCMSNRSPKARNTRSRMSRLMPPPGRATERNCSIT